MSFFITCPDCGANLDPGEKCDCKKKEACTGGAAQTSNNVKTLINYTTKKGDCQYDASGNFES